MKNYMNDLVKNLKKDKQLRETWQANIAMAYMDNWSWHAKKTGKTVMNREDRHIISNNAADYFLKLLCDEIKCPGGR